MLLPDHMGSQKRAVGAAVSRESDVDGTTREPFAANGRSNSGWQPLLNAFGSHSLLNAAK
jgi:hypothetical protein